MLDGNTRADHGCLMRSKSKGLKRVRQMNLTEAQGDKAPHTPNRAERREAKRKAKKQKKASR